jgi:hypothetical protein
LQVFYWELFHTCLSRKLVYSFLFCCVLIWFWDWGNTGFIEWVW